MGNRNVQHIQHGLSTHPLYKTWLNIRQRCNTETCVDYRDYGGRGITVDPRWDDFAVFLDDVGQRPSKQHSLDRIDNEGNYEPGNVRWATAKEQTANRRPAVGVGDLIRLGYLTREQYESEATESPKE